MYIKKVTLNLFSYREQNKILTLLKNLIIMNVRPSNLVKGDKIVIPSPAGRVSKESVKKAIDFLNSYGFEVELTENCTSRHFNYSANDKIRLKELQLSLDDAEAKAILCSRGGYGTGRIFDKLDYTEFLKKPKWLIGFSDITNLHLALNKKGVMSMHGPMTQSFSLKEDLMSVKNLINTLMGEEMGYKIDAHTKNKYGSSQAELIGGNLSIIYSMQATDYEIDTKNKILFIEDLNEYLYHLDRIMINMKMSGKLSELKGLVVGGFTDMIEHKNPFGKTAYEIIHEHVEEYDYPVCFNFPAGHIPNNQPIVLGEIYNLNVFEEGVILKPIVRSPL